MSRGDLTDQQWERLEPLLPRREKTGRPPKDHRLVINGILWVLRTGAPWRDLPERYGPWQTVYSCFYRWQMQRICDQIFAAAQERADAAGDLDWDIHYVDGTTVCAHQHAADANRGTPPQKR